MDHKCYFSSLNEHSRIPKADDDIDDEDDAIVAIVVIFGDDEVPEKFPYRHYSEAEKPDTRFLRASPQVIKSALGLIWSVKI